MMAFVVAAISTTTRADDAGEPIRIRYDAPATCPNEAALVSRLRAHTQGFRLVTGDAPARTFTVSIRTRRDAVVGRLVIRDRGAHEADREVTASSCGEVVGALALVIALTVQAEAPPPGAPEPSRSPPEPLDGDAPPEARKRESPPPAARPAIVATAEGVVDARAPEAPRWHAIFRTGVEMDQGIAANVILSGPVLVEAARDGEGLLRPSLRFGWRYGVSTPRDVEAGGAVRVRRLAASLDGCPLRAGAAFTIAPCMRLEVGALRAEATSIEPARAALRPWIALGPLVHLAWTPVRWLVVEADAALRFPFVRDRLYFEPDGTVFRPAAIGAVLSAGLGAPFP